LDDSLFNAVEDAGESAELAMRMAQIFGYDLDFYTDPRKAIRFAFVLEKRKNTPTGKPAGYGRILAAEYENAGKQYQGVALSRPTGRPGYYSADGKSLQKAFSSIAAEIRCAVTSHFSRARFHPILKTYRPHMGTDYGAPVGTPVQTMGAPSVFAGRKAAKAIWCKSRIRTGTKRCICICRECFVRTASTLKWARRLDWWGARAFYRRRTGFPDLQKGQYKNFEKLGLQPSDPVSKRNLPEFAVLREKWLPVLKNPEILQASVAQSGPPRRPLKAAERCGLIRKQTHIVNR